MRKKYLITGAAIILAVVVLLYKLFLSVEYDIVVYGGGFAGSAAARNAAAAAPGHKVLLIVPDTSQRLGGLGTVGGQNFTDIRHWRGQLVTAGSFGRWYAQAGQFYNTAAMAEIISKDLSQYKNLTVLYSQDLKAVRLDKGQIKGLSLGALRRDQSGVIGWDGQEEKKIRGRIFLDASDEGKLALLSGAALSSGRQDWPLDYLTPAEKEGYPRQQAATLMFKVTGLKTPASPQKVGDLEFVKDQQGSWGLIGGKETWANNPVVQGYNRSKAGTGLAIKPINAAQNGAGSQEWWVNMLLVFNTDGRLHERDRELAPGWIGTNSAAQTIDGAWVKAREALAQPEFVQALRQFKAVSAEGEVGFGEARLVLDQQNRPVVGEVMYIRESVHGLLQGAVNPTGRENSAYALTTLEAQQAGSEPQGGADAVNYQERIGLAYYMMDINAYQPQDLSSQGHYQWPVTGILRPDWQEQGGQPVNPAYLPYSILISPSVPNLLLPGYAASSSSLAWAELRVLPNLAVLGDAAGVAAARAVINKELPAEFGPQQISWIQTKLKQFGARLDK